jgi:hypothetical protein
LRRYSLIRYRRYSLFRGGGYSSFTCLEFLFLNFRQIFENFGENVRPPAGGILQAKFPVYQLLNDCLSMAYKLSTS